MNPKADKETLAIVRPYDFEDAYKMYMPRFFMPAGRPPLNEVIASDNLYPNSDILRFEEERIHEQMQERGIIDFSVHYAAHLRTTDDNDLRDAENIIDEHVKRIREDARERYPEKRYYTDMRISRSALTQKLADFGVEPCIPEVLSLLVQRRNTRPYTESDREEIRRLDEKLQSFDLPPNLKEQLREYS